MGAVQQLINTDAYDIQVFLLVLVCIIFAFVELTKALKYLKDYTGFKTNRERISEKNENEIQNIKTEIVAINERMTKNDEQREEIIKAMNANIEILVEGEMNVLSDLIERRCNDYNDRGYLSIQDANQLESMGASYKRLHGNHGIDTLIGYTQKLPILTDEEIEERKASK